MLQVIPNALLELPNCQTLLADGRSRIMVKTLDRDLIGIGKFVAQPMLLYLTRGQQLIHDRFGVEQMVSAGQVAFLARDVYVVSDFIAAPGETLGAVLVFLDDRLVERFLRRQSASPLPSSSPPSSSPPSSSNTAKPTRQRSALSFEAGPRLAAYFAALPLILPPTASGSACTPPSGSDAGLLELKLLELLHLMAAEPAATGVIAALENESQRHRRSIADVMRAYADEPLSVEDYAALCGRSVSTFGREFRRLHGMTPGRWLQQRRLALAHGALMERGISVTDAALEAGYVNVSHFIRAYREQFGETPKQAQRRVLTTLAA